jgi:MazG nucleotide pyrophosphohydrolase domain.
MNKELKEKFDKIDSKSSIMEIQNYIEDMKIARNFDMINIEREMMLFMEEVGELAKAIRKEKMGHLDVTKVYDTSIEEEVADCFIYLLSIASMSDVDVFKAFKNKEIENFERIWK